MKSKDIRIIARRLQEEGKSYKEIAEILFITRFSARNLITYKLKVIKKKIGLKHKVTKKTSMSIKREISSLGENEERINATKLVRNLSLNVSERTVRRHLLKLDYKYVKATNQIILSKKQKESIVNIITAWLSNNHPWEKTVFSDEKRFSLDGPNNLMTYVKRNSKYIRQKRQCRGGGLMLWLMTLPNGLLSFHSITGTLRSYQYKIGRASCRERVST